ncbi:hypothetical protein BHT95_19155 [Bacillus paralicheniformis]|uniref:hypothetical protein n=1 Tax=Bacillus paralicheniformis TaxID=1648923 RepID=UPI0006819198|nr:hypothetical protein [Bacillus paralicheniformis]KND05443.1 hypothetical protein ACJ43_21380 [Bacillus paralicheniformis]OLQ45370.1 hypothetical protein BHT95_19155 [Bacillus paralicheniformis]WOH92282.1 hypothetical protein RZN08_05565 [Bacillus paralicheniformis]
MKKILLVLFLVLAGCSSAPQNKTDNQTATAEEKTETTEAKSDFSFTLNEFIDEYNKQIDNGIYDGKEKIPSHLQKDEDFFKVDGGSYVQILAKETDNDAEHKSYTLSSIHNKDKELMGINFRISTAFDKDKVLHFSSTGTLAGYKLMKTLNFEEETLQTAFKEADPEYSISNEICNLTLKYQLKKSAIIIEIRPPK